MRLLFLAFVALIVVVRAQETATGEAPPPPDLSGTGAPEPACDPGSVLDGSECAPCAAGSYSVTGEEDSCIPCAAGKYQSLPGQTACANCTAGSYSASTGAATCELCPKDTHQPLPGRNTCLECSDVWGSDEGSADCRDLNYYLDILFYWGMISGIVLVSAMTICLALCFWMACKDCACCCCGPHAKGYRKVEKKRKKKQADEDV